MKKTEIKKLYGVFATLLVLAIFGLFLLSSQQPTSPLYLAEIPEGKTGSEVCYEKDMSCVSTSTSRVVDADERFYGFVTPSCDSQVVRDETCVQSHDTEFAMTNVTYSKSPNAESPHVFSSQNFCIFGGKGTQGVYEFAYCAKK